ncbi:hypothetical protein P3S68_014689 [Capsicum galapagoense]
MNINKTDAVNSTAINVKKTQGRRKIAMKPIANQNSRHITFPRVALIFSRKLVNFAFLCGVEIVSIVQSLKRQRLFTFGHPSADTIINQYLSEKSALDQQFNFVQQNNEYCSQICKELDAKKKKKEIIYESKMVNGNNNEFWWDELVNDIGIEELDKFVDALEELKKRVNMRVNESSMIKGSSLSSTSTMNQAINYCASVVPFDFN